MSADIYASALPCEPRGIVGGCYVFGTALGKTVHLTDEDLLDRQTIRRLIGTEQWARDHFPGTAYMTVRATGGIRVTRVDFDAYRLADHLALSCVRVEQARARAYLAGHRQPQMHASQASPRRKFQRGTRVFASLGLALAAIGATVAAACGAPLR